MERVEGGVHVFFFLEMIKLFFDVFLMFFVLFFWRREGSCFFVVFW